jgi:hypothetical protein
MKAEEALRSASLGTRPPRVTRWLLAMTALLELAWIVFLAALALR